NHKNSSLKILNNPNINSTSYIIKTNIITEDLTFSTGINSNWSFICWAKSWCLVFGSNFMFFSYLFWNLCMSDLNQTASKMVNYIIHYEYHFTISTLQFHLSISNGYHR